MIKGIPVAILTNNTTRVFDEREIGSKYINGIALTDSELEQLKRDAIKDFVKWAVDVGYLYTNLTLEDYEKMYFKQASKKDGEG